MWSWIFHYTVGSILASCYLCIMMHNEQVEHPVPEFSDGCDIITGCLQLKFLNCVLVIFFIYPCFLTLLTRLCPTDTTLKKDPTKFYLLLSVRISVGALSKALVNGWRCAVSARTVYEKCVSKDLLWCAFQNVGRIANLSIFTLYQIKAVVCRCPSK